jgi:hypothetical protein
MKPTYIRAYQEYIKASMDKAVFIGFLALSTQARTCKGSQIQDQ